MDKRERTTIEQMAFAGLVLFFITDISLFVLLSALLLLGVLAEFRGMSAVAHFWERFTGKVGNTLVKAVLFFFFYFIFTPYAFFVRIFRSPKKSSPKTVFETIEKGYDAASFEKPW